MKNALLLALPFLCAVALIFITVYAKSHWIRATAGSLILIAWIITALVPQARLSYQREASEVLIKKMHRRMSNGEQMIPYEMLQDSVDELKAGANPLAALLDLALELKNPAQQGGDDEPATAVESEPSDELNLNPELQPRPQ